ncbi:MAG TPA: type II secretion system F family protein [Pirellulales bacterium]|nr:type II secretion system F family protein [Pirellulales bacterium]
MPSLPALLADIGHGLDVAASLLAGVAVAVLVRWLFAALTSEDLQQGHEWRYDVSRINELRQLDPLYRLLQPLVEALARFNRAAFRDQLPEIQRQVFAAGLPRFWLAEEYLARAETIALLLTPFYLYVFVSWFGPDGALLTIAAAPLTVYLLRRRLAGRANCRLVLIKRRLPYLLDLLTLLMEAGATFLQALEQSVHELEGHPVAVEFSRVLADMSMGKTRTEALESLRARLSDDDVTSVVGSIIQGEELGTPLARVFRTQADVLRIKRTQRAEGIAGEAGVKMLLPGILIMASTSLIILGPFVMNYLFSGFSL